MLVSFKPDHHQAEHSTPSSGASILTRLTQAGPSLGKSAMAASLFKIWLNDKAPYLCKGVGQGFPFCSRDRGMVCLSDDQGLALRVHQELARRVGQAQALQQAVRSGAQLWGVRGELTLAVDACDPFTLTEGGSCLLQHVGAGV